MSEGRKSSSLDSEVPVLRDLEYILNILDCMSLSSINDSECVNNRLVTE